MPVTHHDLAHEFPEYKEAIHELKMNNAHFKKLFDEYHDLTRSVENMQNEITPVNTQTEELAKTRRVHIKDQLYKILISEVA